MIDFQNVSKQFGTQVVLDGISFRVHPGERVGIVGPNGAGKSTLLALMTGDLSPDAGEIAIPQRLRLGHLRQQLRAQQIDASLLGYAENALPSLFAVQREIMEIEARLAGLEQAEKERALRRLGELETAFDHGGGYQLKHRAQAILSGLGFAVDAFPRPFRTFSGGWQMRAELARVLVSRPDILLLDEPTNFLDVPAVEWLHDFLRDFPGTLLLISHDRYLLNSLTAVTLEVAGQRVTRYPGNYDYYIRERRQRYEQLAAAKQNQDRRREQLERFVERFKAKATKASQAQSRAKQLEKMEEIVLPIEIIRPPAIRLPPPPHSGVEMLRLDDAGVTYDGQHWVFEHLNLRLERGDKAGVIGLNGMGKSTLLRLLVGKLAPTAGVRVLGHQVVPGYFSQEFTETLDPARSVFQTIRAAAPDLPEKELRALLGSFRFPGDAIEKQVEVLSGGEKSRLALLRLLVRPANLLVLDEPTTHLDIASREALEKALREYAGTLVLVTHDIAFMRQVATTVFTLTGAGFTRYFGDYDYYRTKLAEEQAAAGPRRDVPAEPQTPADERRQRKREEAERRQHLSSRRKPLETCLAAAEGQVAALHAEQTKLLAQMSAGGDSVDFGAVSRRLGEIQREIATATAKWEAAALELDQVLADAGGEEK